MKKILFILLFLININLVKAEVYYSDYSNYNYSETEIKENDITKVEVIKSYKWYRIDKVEQGYFKNSMYPVKDETDYIYTDFNEWNPVKPIGEDLIVEEKTFYQYREINDIRYVYFYDLIGSYDHFRITELEVYSGNQKIDYDYTCDGCLPGFENIKNGIYAENLSQIQNNGKLTIDLKDYYKAKDIKLIFWVYDMLDNNKFVNISLANNTVYNYSYTLDDRFSAYSWNDSKKFEIPSTYFALANPVFKEYQISEEQQCFDIFQEVNEFQQYRFKEKLYKYYDLKKEFSSEYSIDPIGNYNLKDETDYINVYKYQTRDKFEIFKTVIDDKNQKLEDLVLSTTEYKINGQIDVTKNGEYVVNFILPYQTISQSFIVDIEENTVLENVNKDLILKENEINVLKEKLQNCQNDCSQKTTNCENKIQELNTQISNLQNEVDNYIDKINSKTNLNEAYYIKIGELTAKINNQNEIIKKLIAEKNPNDFKNLENQILSLKNEKEELINKLSFQEEKVNDHRSGILKINSRYNNIVLICLTLLAILLLFIRLMQKRSN